MSRLTRQEMKRDEVREKFEVFLHYVAAHWKPLVAGFGIIVVAILGYFGIQELMSHRDEQAGEMLSRALRVASAPVGVVDAKPEDELAPSFSDETARDEKAKALFLEIQDEYGRTSSGAVSGVYLAGLAMAEGRTDEARILWQEFLDARPDHLLTATVKVNLLHLDRAEGKGEQVVAELEQELDRKAGRVLPEDVLLYELGATLEELGRSDEAKEHFQRLVDEFPQSGFRTEAQQSLGALPD
jgi:tetratricopeptide (TPR) repeat protein